jgi:hypothetical protein
MNASGERTDIIANKKGKKEWIPVAAINGGKIGVESDRNESEFEYNMPAVEPEVGMVVGFMSEGTAAIDGCIVRIEYDIMLEVNAGVEVL